MGYLQVISASLVAAILSLVIWKFAKFLFVEWASPLRVLPGPPNPSLLYGNMKQIWDAVRALVCQPTSQANMQTASDGIT